MPRRNCGSRASAAELVILVSLLLATQTTTAAAQTKVTIACTASTPYRLTLPSDTGALAKIGIATSGASWLEIEEQGLELDSAPGEPLTELRIAAPPRHGWRFVKVDSSRSISLLRARRGDRKAAVLLKLHCDNSPGLELRVAWFTEASQIAASLSEQHAVANIESILVYIDHVVSIAPDAKTRAFGLHLRAQALLFAARSADAAKAFAVAEEAWTSLGDLDRARVARVARIEDSIRAGQYAVAIELARAFPGAPSGDSYFAVRMERSRCLALTYLGRIADAERCYPSVLANLQSLEEQGELANTLQAYAGLEVDAANYARAEELAHRGLELATGVDASLYRGRIHLLLADIALRRGFVSEGLAACDVALSEFGQVHALRWEANTLLKIAQLHEQLGDYEEAYSSLSQALRRISARDAPSRWAKGMELFADLERDQGHLESAYFWQRTAEQLYAQLGMTADLEGALLSRLNIGLQLGRLPSIEQALSEHQSSLPLNVPGFGLLMADLALQLNRPADARRELDNLRSEPMSLHARVHFSTLESEFKRSTGDTEGALVMLIESAQRIEEVAKRTQSEVLRELIARQAAPLQQTAFLMALDYADAQGGSGLAIDTIWSWLALGANGRKAWSDAGSIVGSAESFDNAVALELMTPSAASRLSSESRAQRELLSLLGRSDKRPKPRESRDAAHLAALMEELKPDSTFIAYLEAGTRGALLWVERDRVALVDAAPPDQVRMSVVALRELMRSPASPVVQIQAAADQLAAQLLGGVAVGQPPKRLYVLTGEPLNGVPWEALTWPGSSTVLADTTTVEFVRLDPTVVDAVVSPASVEVIVAAQQGDQHALPTLEGAQQESAAIGSAIVQSTIRVRTPTATRAVVLTTLHEPGSWVHIAAHGMAQPQRIGYAGIWLEPSGEEKTPQFLSWIDILESDVRADLVVLNACQLGDSGTAVSGNISFADAVSRAGAMHVVASLWPVSDAASALWVPAFYGAITADPLHNAAGALRVAQLRLRESRAFRHPFFWAGMQAINRMPIGSQAAH